MGSDERDLLLQNLRHLHLSHAARDLDDHLRQATQLKLGHLGFLARAMEAEVLARTETGTQRRVDQAHSPEIRRDDRIASSLRLVLDDFLLARAGLLRKGLVAYDPVGPRYQVLSLPPRPVLCAATVRTDTAERRAQHPEPVHDLIRDFLARMDLDHR